MDSPIDMALNCGGLAGELVAGLDWSKTPLGPMDRWPRSLQAAASLVLRHAFAMNVSWGPDLIQIYNDATIPIMGRKHPSAMGQPVSETWAEIWGFLEPTLRGVWESGQALMIKGNRFLIDRKGFLEELFVDISYSVVRGDDGAVAGILSTSIESTERVVGERRLRSLKDLAALKAGSEEECLPLIMEVIGKNPFDIPFGLLYLVNEGGASLRLAGACGIPSGLKASPLQVSLGEIGSDSWPFGRCLEGGIQTVMDLKTRFGSLGREDAAVPSDAALLLPIFFPGEKNHGAVFVAGLASCLELSNDYREFLDLVVREIGSSVANLRALREAREKAEALAALDQAKTLFLSNVSHEFRTPLTLLLGPIEDLLSDKIHPLSGGQRSLMVTARRNAHRLLKLVNALLDFSRLEAGRMQARFEPTALGDFTRDLASLFESACRKAGIGLSVHMEPLTEPVFVDRDMWEKIVVNLLSNALKFTLRGEIVISLRDAGGAVRLVVADSGSGIPQASLPHLFERFYRVPEQEARTHEGAGIGLALVLELARFHGGTVGVESTVGQGSVFTVEIPKGFGHLPQKMVLKNEDLHSTLRPPSSSEVELSSPASEVLANEIKRNAPFILVADDNADMRRYLEGILNPHYEVETVADGAAALEAVRRRLPDLVLSDVMMPKLDGLGLLRELRGDATTGTVPVILLSARAGSEASLEALSAGADDYVFKPFSAGELLARVKSNLALVCARKEAVASGLKDIFIGVAAHELKTPLTSLVLRSSILESEIARTGSEKLSKNMGHMLDSLGRLERLVNELLVAATLKSGKLPFHPKSCDLVAITRSAAREEMEIFGRELTLALPVAPVWAVADPDRIFQLLSNLISNALKFSPEDLPVSVSLNAGEGEAVFSVEDKGPGIPESHHESVFESYHKVPENPIRLGARVGLGLGLYIAKSIVDEHGGKIEIRSGTGKGTMMTVKLPLQKSPASPP